LEVALGPDEGFDDEDLLSTTDAQHFCYEEAVSSPRRSYIVTSEKLMAGWCQREGAP
jgi:hypothetical protein